MATERNAPGLQVAEDLRFQSRQWRVQSLARWFLYAVVLAALAGAFGDGPLAHAHVGDPAALSAEYPRLMRRESRQELRVELPVPAHGAPALEVASEWLVELGVERVQPQPQWAIANGGTTTLVFARGRAGELLRVTLIARPETIGTVEGYVALPGRPRLPLRHFVYP